MFGDGIDYEAIQRRVTQRVQRRYRFFIHSSLFVIGIPLIGGWASAQIFLLWIAAWVCHLIYYNYQNHLEYAIDEEIEREEERLLKRKHETLDLLERLPESEFQRPEWLGDDGELLHTDEHY